jgi:hypothetical protein
MKTIQRRRKHYVPEPRAYVALNDTALFILEHVIKRRFLTTAHILMLIEAQGGSAQQTRRLLRDLTDGGYLTRVAGKFVRKYTLRRYSLFFKEMEAKSAEFSTPS